MLGFLIRRIPPELVFVTLGIRGIGSKACFAVVDFKQIAMLVPEVEIAVRAVSHSQWRRHRLVVFSLATSHLKCIHGTAVITSDTGPEFVHRAHCMPVFALRTFFLAILGEIARQLVAVVA